MTTEILVERLGHHADGVAHGPVYAARVLPGERVRGTLVGDRLAAPKVISPSEHRVKAPCSHYKGCGGCAVQHASDGFVADWKSEIVRNALAARGLEAPFRPMHTSPPKSRRRATFSGRRAKSGALVGFHAPASSTVVATPDCLLLTAPLLHGRAVLEALVIAGGSRKAELKLAVTQVEQGLDVLVSGGKPLDRELRATLGEIAGGFGLARLIWDGEQIAQVDQPTVRFDGIAVPLPPGAFLQATAEGETALLSAVRDAIGDAARVVDLFSGCGTFALPLARASEVLAVEGDAALTQAAEKGARHATGLRPVRTMTRDLFRNPLDASDLKDFDAAVIDPPRAGAEAQIACLAQSAVRTIAHVSCNPVTFARDAATLVSAGFRLDWVQVIDQFRWSAHVELAARFSRSK